VENALSLDGGQTTLMAITVALTVLGLVALGLAVLWPVRWRIKYRLEFVFILGLLAMAWYADWNSTRTYQAYQGKMSAGEAVSGTEVTQADTFFDRTLTVITFQWGFAFLTEDDEISRNAAVVKPGEKVLFKIVSNDVIHGFNIPAASITAEIDPDEVRQVWIRAPDKPGKYLIQCVNYCGVGHAQMKAWLVVEGAEETSELTGGETTDGA
jgi:heme/copper-type cytochrome/quinol oxidase subunit 2